MDFLVTLLSFDLTIPLWQMIAYIFLISIFMLRHKPTFCFVTTYVYVLYWIFYIFGPHFISKTGDDPLALTLYILFGLGMTSLSIFALLFYED